MESLASFASSAGKKLTELASLDFEADFAHAVGVFVSAEQLLEQSESDMDEAHHT